jgi:hypothetical protein
MRPHRQGVKLATLDLLAESRYASAMTAPTRVQLADERSDRPRWLAVVGVAAAGLVGGLLVALAYGRSQHEGEAPEVPPSAPAIAANVGAADEHAAPAAAPAGATGTAPVAIDDVPLQAAVPTLPANVGAGAPIPGEPAAMPDPTAAASEPTAVGPTAVPAAAVAPVEPAAAPTATVAAPAPAAPAPAAASAQHTIVHGQLAYLRCEGVPLESGPYPCPRDRHFERQVWSAIDGLQQCSLPALSTPDVELRVELKSRGGKHALEVRPADGSSAFANAALACLTTPLESVRTQLRPIFMVVAFRFEVQ